MASILSCGCKPAARKTIPFQIPDTVAVEDFLEMKSLLVINLRALQGQSEHYLLVSYVNWIYIPKLVQAASFAPPPRLQTSKSMWAQGCVYITLF